MPNTVIASMEGMKITAHEKHGELSQYNFETNQWELVEAEPLPLAATVAREWLGGWNRVDFSRAFSLLTSSEAVEK